MKFPLANFPDCWSHSLLEAQELGCLHLRRICSPRGEKAYSVHSGGWHLGSVFFLWKHTFVCVLVFHLYIYQCVQKFPLVCLPCLF